MISGRYPEVWSRLRWPFGLGDVAPQATGRILDGTTVAPETWRCLPTAVYL